MALRERLEVLADASSVSDRAAHMIVANARGAIAERGRCSIALTGGSSPLETYSLLAKAPFRDAIDWSRVDLFWGDERAVPPDHRDSNFGAAWNRFVKSMSIAPSNVHRMEAERADLEAAAREYAERLRDRCDVLGEDRVPILDLLLLGIGGNAHILSLYPGCPEIMHPTADVVALRDPPMDPAISRITLTPRPLFAARAILVFAPSAAKAEPLAALLQAPDDPVHLPAQLLRRAVAERVTILADRASASRLSA